MTEYQMILSMIRLQNRLNKKIHNEWYTQGFNFHLAAIVELGELAEEVGYKWWKKQETNVVKAQQELVDVWHFLLSHLLEKGLINKKELNASEKLIEERLANDIYEDFADYGYIKNSQKHTNQLIKLLAINPRVPLFVDIMHYLGMTLEDLYKMYVGKNILNEFRQENGFKEGTYQKVWDGREDNEHLNDILANCTSPEEIYEKLKESYDNRS